MNEANPWVWVAIVVFLLLAVALVIYGLAVTAWA